jgi:hypothetical protein
VAAGCGSAALQVIGLVMCVLGLFSLLRFNNMDTTVEVPSVTGPFGGSIGGGRVHNIGLMDERRNGLMLSGGAVVLGALLVIGGRRG